MSGFLTCLTDAVGEGSLDKWRAEKATEYWRELRDRYRRQGHDEWTADAMAGEDVKEAMRRFAADERHAFIAKRAAMRKAEAAVKNAKDLRYLGPDRVEQNVNRKNKTLPIAQQIDGLNRYFYQRLSDLAYAADRNMMTGKSRDPALLKDIYRALYNQPVENPRAQSVAGVVREAMSEMRRMANEAGANIGELADWGMPHTHDWIKISRAGFDGWAQKIEAEIDWHRMEDHLTGKPMADEGQMPEMEYRRRFLREVYENGAFGKDADDPTYGRPEGENLFKRRGHERVLHFRDADAWMRYNEEFGAADPYTTIMNHAHSMAEDIVAMREYGPSWRIGMQYERDLAIKRAKDEGLEIRGEIDAGYDNARRMMQIRRGGPRPKSLAQAQRAQFFASTRTMVSAALLDRAVLASLSDMNSMRMAAYSMGANPNNVLSRHLKLISSESSRADIKRARVIGEHLFNSSAIMNRWSAEVPPKHFADNISSAVFYGTGLTGWTQQARTAVQLEWAGVLADYAGQRMADMEPQHRRILEARGITEDDWAAFSDPDLLFRSQIDEEATFMDPIYWRQVTDMDPARADELYLKFQTVAEEFTELGVPTQSLAVRARIEGDQIPGDAGYELLKSASMVKSFVMSFTINQIRATLATNSHRILGLGPEFTGNAARAARTIEMVAGATVMGALSLQVINLASGRDPSDMSDPAFWPKAALKGGGFGIIGDLFAAGQTTFPGAISSWALGPMPDLIGETFALTVGNALEVASGESSGFGKELVEYVDRWGPGLDAPPIGLAVDRLLMEPLMMMLDPDAATALQRQAKSRETYHGTDHFWTPGSAMPERAPNPANMFGG